MSAIKMKYMIIFSILTLSYFASGLPSPEKTSLPATAELSRKSTLDKPVLKKSDEKKVKAKEEVEEDESDYDDEYDEEPPLIIYGGLKPGLDPWKAEEKDKDKRVASKDPGLPSFGYETTEKKKKVNEKDEEAEYPNFFYPREIAFDLPEDVYKTQEKTSETPDEKQMEIPFLGIPFLFGTESRRPFGFRPNTEEDSEEEEEEEEEEEPEEEERDPRLRFREFLFNRRLIPRIPLFLFNPRLFSEMTSENKEATSKNLKASDVKTDSYILKNNDKETSAVYKADKSTIKKPAK